MIDEKSVRIRNSKNHLEWANGSGIYRGKENAFVYWDQSHAQMCINERYAGGEIVIGLLEEEKPIEQQRVWGVWLTPGLECSSSAEAGGMPHWLYNGTFREQTHAEATHDCNHPYRRSNPCWNFEVRRLPEMKTYDASKVECFIGGVKVTGFADISFSTSATELATLRKRAETAERECAAETKRANEACTLANSVQTELARVQEFHRVAVERAELAFNRANKAEGALDTLREKAKALLDARADVTTAFKAENGARHGLIVAVGR